MFILNMAKFSNNEVSAYVINSCEPDCSEQSVSGHLSTLMSLSGHVFGEQPIRRKGREKRAKKFCFQMFS